MSLLECAMRAGDTLAKFWLNGGHAPLDEETPVTGIVSRLIAICGTNRLTVGSYAWQDEPIDAGREILALV